jgi:hypothetical protein
MENRLIARHRKMAMHDQSDNWFGRQQVEPIAEDVGLPAGRGEAKKKKRKAHRKIINDQWKAKHKEYLASLPEDHWMKILFR